MRRILTSTPVDDGILVLLDDGAVYHAKRDGATECDPVPGTHRADGKVNGPPIIEVDMEAAEKRVLAQMGASDGEAAEVPE